MAREVNMGSTDELPGGFISLYLWQSMIKRLKEPQSTDIKF